MDNVVDKALKEYITSQGYKEVTEPETEDNLYHNDTKKSKSKEDKKKILENQEAMSTQELEKEFEEGLTEPMTKNEEEVKEDPNEYQFININPSGDNQDSIPVEVQDGETYEDCSSQSQPIEEDQERQEEEDTSAGQPQLTEVEEFKHWQDAVAPELEKMKHVTSREGFHRLEKSFYQLYDEKVEETGFINERVRKRMDSYIDDFISSWKYITYSKWR